MLWAHKSSTLEVGKVCVLNSQGTWDPVMLKSQREVRQDLCLCFPLLPDWVKPKEPRILKLRSKEIETDYS